jgi:integrase
LLHLPREDGYRHKATPKNGPALAGLEPDQIMALAAAVTSPPVRYRHEERRRERYPEYGLLVSFAGFSGLRAVEIVALRVADLDLMRRRVDVKASISEAYGELQLVAPRHTRGAPCRSRSR